MQFLPCEVTISLLEDVVVAEEGLVFTRALDLLQPSLTQHSADEVERARAAILGGMKSGNIGHFGGTAALCKKRGSRNYGHWIMEMLPKAFVVRRNWPQATGYIVQATSDPLGGVIAESLSRLGIERNAVLEVGDAPVHVDRLLLVDGLTSHGAYMSPLVMECVETIASDVPPENMKCIFVVRGDLPSRHFVGEDAIRALATQRGYTVVDPAKMSLVRQIACFKGASRIVGAMGAAMTNVAFCQPGTEVFCLTPANMADTFFWFISGLRGLHYTEVRCEQVLPRRGPMPWDTDLLLSSEDKELLFVNPELKDKI
jgi:capsular polysaccharide biosynthesis protein